MSSMFCAGCGNSIATDDKFCRVCGRQPSAAPAAPPAVHASGATETSGKAIISLVCGLLFFVPLMFVAAIVFGHLALSEIRRSAGRLKGQGIAITGLVLGYLWIVTTPVFLIIAAIAIPNLLRARMAANESSAIASVRTLNSAEFSYAGLHPETGFTCSLSDLAGARLIDAALASGQKYGYAFELKDCTAEAAGGPNVKYQVLAHPVSVPQSGVRAFCSDESATLKADSAASGQGCVENGTALD